jgi:hypothetical protein
MPPFAASFFLPLPSSQLDMAEAWSYGPPDDPQRLTGTDVGVTKDGKLTALYVFIDPPSQK